MVKDTRKTAFLFPGQGAQYVGMGKDFYASFKEAREIFDQANTILGFDLAALCFQGKQEELNKKNLQLREQIEATLRELDSLLDQVGESVEWHDEATRA